VTGCIGENNQGELQGYGIAQSHGSSYGGVKFEIVFGSNDTSFHEELQRWWYSLMYNELSNHKCRKRNQETNMRLDITQEGQALPTKQVASER